MSTSWAACLKRTCGCAPGEGCAVERYLASFRSEAECTSCGTTIPADTDTDIHGNQECGTCANG